MRKMLMSLVLLGGVAGAGAGVQAAPAATAPVLNNAAHLQTVQYAPGWREREYWRARRHEEWRRREAWRRHHEWRERHAYGYRY